MDDLTCVRRRSHETDEDKNKVGLTEEMSRTEEEKKRVRKESPINKTERTERKERRRSGREVVVEVVVVCLLGSTEQGSNKNR